MYTLSHNYLQEGCINSKFSPGGNSFLESVTQASIFYSVLFPCYERISAFRKKSIIEHACITFCISIIEQAMPDDQGAISTTFILHQRDD